MTALSIGFHVGPGGNRNGIGDHWRALDGANIPAFLKSADDYGPCGELAAIAAASGVPHVIIFRLTGQGYDVPNYALSPATAALDHWNRIKAKLPPEFDKSRVWVEPINEVDKGRADWLGWFAVEIATLANAQGYKVTLFGWSSGEPEPAHWHTEGMLAYLDYCATRPNAAAISLHEYSYDRTKMPETSPYLLGRFQNIINTCTAEGIPYPTIHITEWGWEYQNVPDPATAMTHIAWAYDMYKPYPNVRGCATWYLGMGYGDIANQTQKLIVPVTQFTLAHPPVEPPPPTPPVNYKVVAHLTPPTLIRAEYDQISNEAFPVKQSVIFSADDAARLVAPGLPGSKVIAWWPNRWTDDIVSWLKSKGVQTVETRPQTPPPPNFRLASPVVGIPLYVTDRFNSPRSYSPPYHEGLDLRATNSNGQAVKIVAGSSGIIDGIRRTDPGSGYGLYVRVRTVVGSVTYIVWYCHLSAIPSALVVGQAVVGGQEIGTAGSTGNSTGIHLHLTVQKVPGGLPGYIVADVIDPAPLLGLPASTLPGPGSTPPPTGNARMGLHADADGRMPAADYKEFTDLKPGVIKVLSSHSFEAINRLATEHPTATFIVRAFLSFWENGKPRVITPTQFVNDTINDVKRAVNAIATAGKGQAIWVELHNEPNLIQEGLGGAWSNGTTFGVWLTDVLTRYDQALPQVKYLFPGLSPGPTVPGVRQDSTQFMNQCLSAAALCDGLGVHAYWNHIDAPLTTALAVVDGYLAQVPTLPVWVTEASSNKGATADSMATDYVTCWREMLKRPRVQGVTYYVCSASDPAFANETWTPRGLGAKVRGKM